MQELIMPESKTSWAARVAYVELVKHKLWLEHNAMGHRKDLGLITAQQWQIYQDRSFYPKSVAISRAINKLRESPPQAELNQIDLDDGFKIVSAEKPLK